MSLFRPLSFFFQGLDMLPEFQDLSDLKDKGELTEESETNGDRITKRSHFKSFDGLTEITRIVTTNVEAAKYDKLYELRSKINDLLEEEKFEEAIPLRDELKKLEAELKPKNQKRLK